MQPVTLTSSRARVAFLELNLTQFTLIQTTMEEKETGITKMAIDYYFLQDVRSTPRSFPFSHIR